MKLPTTERLRSVAHDARRAVRTAGVTLSRSALPQEDGTLTLGRDEGLSGPVEVLRDAHGVPHVFARSDLDALFAQGFVHAQDRLFQLDSTRRMAQGRLAELGGARLRASDRFIRRLGLADRAGRDYAAAAPDERAALEAYARGLNAGVRSLRALPPEYALLEVTPEPWHPEHTLLVARLVLFTFSMNWDTELLRERLLAAVGPERAAALDVPYPSSALTVTGSLPPAGERVVEAYHAAIEAGLSPGGASNAWALAPSRSATGGPLLASDPHLQSRLPSLFHVAHLAAPSFDAVGAGIAGIPGVFIGHNGHVAWGITAGMADVADCFVEEVDPANPARYRVGEEWVVGRTRIERILVRDGETVEESVLETRHGPVVGPALRGESRAIALRNTALEDGDLARPALDLLRARTSEAFEAALEEWPGATFNFVWAHRAGSIGYRMAGLVPQRAHGEGLLPHDGPRSPGPAPTVPPGEMPRTVDPPEGMVVSANNAPGGDLELGSEFCDRFRAERIAMLLRARERHTIASLQAIQVDMHSAPLVALRDLLLETRAVTDEETRHMLAAWSGQVAASSPAAALLESVYIEVARAMIARLAGEPGEIALGRGLGGGGWTGGSAFHYRLQGHLMAALAEPARPWFEEGADTTPLEERDRLLRAAAWRALEQLRGSLGRESHRWRWGDLHRVRLAHPLEDVPAVGRLFSRGPLPYGGDNNTVSQGGYSVYGGASSSGFSPAYRQVIDLAHPDASTFSLPSGNSGIPGHRHYDDMIEEHLEGRQRPLLYTRDAIERQTAHRLTLVPARTPDGGS